MRVANTTLGGKRREDEEEEERRRAQASDVYVQGSKSGARPEKYIVDGVDTLARSGEDVYVQGSTSGARPEVVLPIETAPAAPTLPGSAGKVEAAAPVHTEVPQAPAVDMEKYSDPAADNPITRAINRVLDYVGDAAISGVSQFTTGFANTADLLLGRALRGLGWKNNPVSVGADIMNEYNDELARQMMTTAGDSKAAQLGAQALSGTVAAAPAAIMAYLTGGASLASTGGVEATAAAQSMSTGQAVAQSVSKMMQNPSYWTSFIQEAGNNYREAQEWAKDDDTAAIYALTVGLINSGVEIGLDGASGIQGLERQIASGDTSGLRSFLRSALGEGREEIEQGLVSRGLGQLFGSGAPTFSTTDPNAVINPGAMAQEGAMGAVVGGLLSGASMGANAVANRVHIPAAATQAQAPVEAPQANETGSNPVLDALGDIESRQGAQAAPGAPQGSLTADDVTAAILGEAPLSRAAAQAQTQAQTQVPAEMPGASWGDTGTAYTDGNRAVGFRYAVVPASSLTASNDVYGNVNEAYPAELQPRDRSRAASQMQMSNMAAQLNPALLMESPTAQNGSPIVRSDGVVLGGNARTTAILQAYERGTAGEYEAAVRENAARFGIDPATVPEHPVLVRVADGGDWAGLARDLNSTTVSTYSATEQARVDSEKVGDILDLLVPDDTGNINTAANRDFIQAFVGRVAGSSETNSLVMPDGRLSQEGLRRVEYAVFDRAYGDASLVERLAESNDNDARNVTNALLAAASNAATVNAEIEAGELYDFDVTGRIVEGVNLYLQAKSSRQTVAEMAAQRDLFDDSSAISMEIAEAVEAKKNSGRKLRELFTAFYDALRSYGSPDQGSLFAAAAPTTTDLLRGVNATYEQRTGDTVDLGAGRFEGRAEIGTRGQGPGAEASDTGQYYSRGGPGAVPSEAGEYGGVTSPTVQGSPEGVQFHNIGAAERGFADNAYNRWVENADELHRTGEDAARNASLPTQNLKGKNTSKVGQTVMEAANTPDERVIDIQNRYLTGGFTIKSTTDARLTGKAAFNFNAHPEEAIKSWSNDVHDGKVSNDLVAMGAVILDSDRVKSDPELFMSVLTDYIQLCSTAGQALQAQRIYKALSPEGRLYAVKKVAEKLGEELGRKIDISSEDAGALLGAETDADADDAMDAIYQRIADQIPSTFMDKWTALRYMNMLGNFKTQIRNLAGNSLMSGMKAVKNTAAAALESAVARFNPDMERTQSLHVGKAWMDAARADFDSVREAAMGNGRYNDSSNNAIEQEIESRRTIFKPGTWGENSDSAVVRGLRRAEGALLRVPELYRRITNWATNVGDEIFIKHHYARALAGYLKANGVQVEQFLEGNVDEGLLSRATDFAVREAQEATFHDNNAFSDWVARMGRSQNTPRAARLIGEGVAPFRKTPANVLVRAYEYSPAGFIDTAVKAVKASRGDASASDVINSLARSLTGSGIMALGMALAAKGMLRGTGDEEDSEIDELMNRQDYSLTLPGMPSYTIDWLTPATMPLFMGANLWDIIDDGEIDLADMDSVLARFTEPILETSMLSGVNDAISNVKFSENHLGQIAATYALNYALQGITNSFLGQVERSLEPTRTATYATKDNPLPDWLERTLGKASAKLPGIDFQQAEYLDELGNIESNGSLAERVIENIISPGYWTTTHEGEAFYDNLQAVHDETGANPWPDAYPPNSFKVGGETYALGQDDKDQYQRTRGSIYRDLAGEIFDDGRFKGQELADILSDITSYANAQAKDEYLDSIGVGYDPASSDISRAVSASQEAGIPLSDYLDYAIRKDSLTWAKGVNNAKKEAVVGLIDSLDLTRAQKLWLYSLEGYKGDVTFR